MPGGSEQEGTEAAYFDLTDHPWAGLDVTVQLRLEDTAGQTGLSETEEMTLAARIFHDPLARALIEQRRNLVEDVASWTLVAKALEALTYSPHRFPTESVVYLGMRTARWRLVHRQPKASSDIDDVVALLWDLALRIEDGGLSAAERDLREIQDELMAALAEGAPAEEINRLLEEFKAAMARYLSELAQQQGSQLSESTELATGPNESITPDDLARILQAIEDLANSGDTAGARDLANELRALLENLQQPQQAGELTPQEKAMADAMEALEGIIDEEMALTDDTLVTSNALNDGRPKEELPEGASPEELTDRQDAIRRKLAEVLGDLEGSGAPTPQSLAEAEEAMRNAEGELEREMFGNALREENTALDRLRQGAEEISENLAQSLMERGLQPQSQGANRDPLGRESGNPMDGKVNMPDEEELQRAREILKKLQERAAERGRPAKELDYLERLLRRF